MALTFVILLSCLAYGIVASPPSSSYLPPVGATPGGRPPIPSGPAGGIRPIAAGPVVSGPSSSYLPPSKGAGRRPSAVGPGSSVPVPSAPIVSAPGAQRPVGNIIPASVGGKRPGSYRPIAAAPSVQQGSIIGAPSVGRKRPALQAPLAAAPQRVPLAGTAPRPISSGNSKAGHGSRTVGSKAPY